MAVSMVVFSCASSAVLALREGEAFTYADAFGFKRQREEEGGKCDLY